jgi:hypothetical protein
LPTGSCVVQKRTAPGRRRQIADLFVVEGRARKSATRIADALLIVADAAAKLRHDAGATALDRAAQGGGGLRNCPDGDVAPLASGLRHCLHGVHGQVDDNLLQLRMVTNYRAQALSREVQDGYTACLHLVAEEHQGVHSIGRTAELLLRTDGTAAARKSAAACQKLSNNTP